MSENEEYPEDWLRAVLMVNPKTGEIHCIGGDHEPGEGDQPCPGYDYITELKRELEQGPLAREYKAEADRLRKALGSIRAKHAALPRQELGRFSTVQICDDALAEPRMECGSCRVESAVLFKCISPDGLEENTRKLCKSCKKKSEDPPEGVKKLNARWHPKYASYAVDGSIYSSMWKWKMYILNLLPDHNLEGLAYEEDLLHDFGHAMVYVKYAEFDTDISTIGDDGCVDENVDVAWVVFVLRAMRDRLIWLRKNPSGSLFLPELRHAIKILR